MMKTIIPAVFLVFYCLSCNDGPTQAEGQSRKQLSDLEPDFKFRNLQAFSIDSFTWGTRGNHYKELDSQSYKVIWQDPGDAYNPEGYDRSFLYAWQQPHHKNFTECAMLREIEGDNGPTIWYCIFDAKGKAVDHFIAAADCADGGWYYQSHGKFVKPGVYEATCIEQEFVEMDSTDGGERYEGDTTVMQYTIGSNGKVSEKQLYKKAFTVKE